MATNPKDTAARKLIGKFARTLLATTCLTVGSGIAAHAGVIVYTEGTAPAPADFSNTFGGANPLTAGNPTTVVTGNVTGGDTQDFFELTGLGSGTFTIAVSDATPTGTAQITLLDTGDNNLGGPTIFDSGEAAIFASQTIPVDGNLIVQITGLGETSANYTVTVNTTSTAPEPGTVATLGLGLAGALALGRRRSKQ